MVDATGFEGRMNGIEAVLRIFFRAMTSEQREAVLSELTEEVNLETPDFDSWPTFQQLSNEGKQAFLADVISEKLMKEGFLKSLQEEDF